MSNPFFIKQGDLLPELTAKIKDGTGAAIDLTGATVTFSMAKVDDSLLKINNASATIVTALTGDVKYTWAGTDTNTAGLYKAEFKTTISTKPFRAPNSGYITVVILPVVA